MPIEFIAPGDQAFSEPIPQSNSSVPQVFQGDLVGRVLALDVTRAKRWQCGGFSVSINNPLGVVTPQAQQYRLREALMLGTLIDVTEQHQKGLKSDSIQQDPIQQADTGRKAYITVDGSGALSVIIPKDEAEQVEREQALEKNGILLPDENAEIGGVCAGAASRVHGPEDASQAFENFTNRFRGRS